MEGKWQLIQEKDDKKTIYDVTAHNLILTSIGGGQFKIKGYCEKSLTQVSVPGALPEEDPLNSCELRDTCDACFSMDKHRCKKWLNAQSEDAELSKLFK